MRRPIWAAAGAAAALGLAYPAILIASSVASSALGKPDLVAAMIYLGFGVPALAVLVLGAWIDASASLYSGSLQIVNQFSRLTLPAVVVGAGVFGVVLSFLHAETAFVPFLMGLGVCLPPVAAAQIAEALITKGEGREVQVARAPIRPAPFVAWAAGTGVGAASTLGLLSLTSIPALDSTLTAVAIISVAHLIARRRASV